MSALPVSHSYLQKHYTSPEEPSRNSRLWFLKKFVSRCVLHFIRSQNEFNANVVRTADSLHQRAEQSERQILELTNNLAQLTNAMRQQQRINNRAEELQTYMINNVKSLQDMQNHHGGVIAQALQKVHDVSGLLEACQSSTDYLAQQLISMSKRQDDLVDNQNEVNARHSKLVKTVLDLDTRAAQITRRQDDVVASLEEFNHEIQGMIRRHDDLVAGLNSSNSHYSDLVTTVRTLDSHYQDVSKRQSDLVATLETFSRETRELTSRHDILVHQLASFHSDLQSLAKDQAGIVKHMHKADIHRTKLSQALEDVPRMESVLKDVGRCTSRIEALDRQCLLFNDKLHKTLQRLALIKDAFNEAAAHIPAGDATKADKDAYLSSIIECKKVLGDEAYLALEDAQRGSEEEITERLQYYLPKIKHITTSATSYFLDIGCGRGEFVQLLTDNDKHARGIDINTVAVAGAKAKGLSVKCTDLFTELERIKPGTLAGISAFHVVEHMPFKHIYRCIELAYSRLKDGGILLLETPNALNLRVAACEFYRDPTHNQPVHPTTLEYTLNQVGFSDITIDFLHPFPKSESLTIRGKSYTKSLSSNFKTLNELLLGSRDCTVIATKKEDV